MSSTTALNLVRQYWFESDTIVEMMAVIDRAKELGIYSQFTSLLYYMIRSDIIGTMNELTQAKGIDNNGEERYYATRESLHDG